MKHARPREIGEPAACSAIFCSLAAVLGCAVPAPQAASPAASERDGAWRECERNGELIHCREDAREGERVVFCGDGLTHRLVCEGECQPNGYLREGAGGRWRHDLYIQGNSRYTHIPSGETLFVPLRPPGRGTGASPLSDRTQKP